MWPYIALAALSLVVLYIPVPLGLKFFIKVVGKKEVSYFRCFLIVLGCSFVLPALIKYVFLKPLGF